MTSWDEEDENLAQFLESEVLSEGSDQDEQYIEEKERPAKRFCKDDNPDDRNETIDRTNIASSSNVVKDCSNSNVIKMELKRIESGILSNVPPELFYHILKFLSSEDLISCSQVCKLMNHVAADDTLWRRLYCLRWGLLPPTKRLRECAWKTLYIGRDEEDLFQSSSNCQPEFKEYYIQMHTAKRSEAPLLSQVNDDQVIVDKTVSDQIDIWKSSKGLNDKLTVDHVCSGESCTYHQIGNVFVCEKTGNVHVCDETCREVFLDPENMLFVCRVSGRCFDTLLSPSEMESDAQQIGAVDEAEPFMGSGRFARAYLLGYNCADEKELEDALTYC
ncbi:hypothetical protein V2J09_014104 [Rumex salicifolius]